MTDTPTPAQHIEVLRSMLGGYNHDIEFEPHYNALLAALAALEAVEAGELLTPDYRGWITAHSNDVTRQWIIIPADAVEVSRG